MTPKLARALSSLLLAMGLFACDGIKATTDRAMMTLSLRPACPEPVDGRAAGADSPEGALGCFRHAVETDSTSLLLRVTCTSRNPASCKQTDATTRDAEKAMVDLKKLSFTNVLGRWDENDKTAVFAIDTKPGEKRVGTVVTCRIVEGDKWAVCEIGEVGRDFADQKIRKGS